MILSCHCMTVCRFNCFIIILWFRGKRKTSLFPSLIIQSTCYFLSFLIWSFAFLFLLAKRRCYKIAKLGKITIVPWNFLLHYDYLRHSYVPLSCMQIFFPVFVRRAYKLKHKSCHYSCGAIFKTSRWNMFMCFIFFIQYPLHISKFLKKRPHCSIVLSSNLSDRYNLKDQFHINKRLHFWCKLFIVCFLFILLSGERMKEIWVDHKIKFFLAHITF